MMVTTWRVVDFATCFPASIDRVHFVETTTVLEGELLPVSALPGETKPPPKGIQKLNPTHTWAPLLERPGNFSGPKEILKSKLVEQQHSSQAVPCSKIVVKTRSVKRCKINAKNARAPFPKSRASYFRSARFNTSPLCYLRACHRLHSSQLTNQSVYASLTDSFIVSFPKL